VLLAGIELATY